MFAIPAFIILGYNYVYQNQTAVLHQKNIELTEELAKFNSHNSLLIDRIANYIDDVNQLGNTLGEIERLSGVDNGDGTQNGNDSDSADGYGRENLTKRIHRIGRFYRTKEDEYSEIGNRVAQIESIMDLQGRSPSGASKNLEARVDTATLSAHIEHLLHSHIPSGYPTKIRVISSEFGERVHPVTNKLAFHNGSDVRVAIGTPVRATANGIVRVANNSKASGNLVVIQHNFGFESYYAHLNTMAVQPGQIIEKGDVLGTSGNSGHSTGPHLHYEVRFLKKPLDPSNFLDWEYGSHEIFTKVKEVQWPSLISMINAQVTPQTLQLSQLESSSPEKQK